MALNLPVQAKKIFLSFLQNWYATQDTNYVWNVDPRLTKIFIGDKYIAAPEIVEKVPSIVLSRGQMAWAFTSIDQLETMDLMMSVQDKNSATGYQDPNVKRTDLMRCSVTFMCLSTNGIEAETLANTLMNNIIAYKYQLRHNGIHQILGVSMDVEQLVRSDAGVRLVSVPVNVVFTMQHTLATTLDLYTITVLIGGEFVPYAESGPYGNVYRSFFSYQISGHTMYFNEPVPSGYSLSVSYRGRYTLNYYSSITPSGLIDGINRVYYLPEDVYTTYAIVSGFVVIPYTNTGPPSYYDYLLS
jgi:hypothetical protein